MYLDVCRAFKCSLCAEHVRESVLAGVLRRPDVLLLGNTTRSDFVIKSVIDNWILLHI